jgi:hypothetical protein
MSEARMKKWRGREPDALFVRNVEWERERNLPLAGTLHVLTPGDALAIASRVADHLRWPDRLPSEDGSYIPLWGDAREAWNYGPDIVTEIKRKLTGSPAPAAVLVRMIADSEEECVFVYDALSDAHARALNGILAEGLNQLRPN